QRRSPSIPRLRVPSPHFSGEPTGINLRLPENLSDGISWRRFVGGQEMRKMRCLFVCLCWLGTTLSAYADLQFDPPWIDLRAVKAGQVFKKEARVTNAGTTPVQVREIKSSCGCLHPKLQPEVLQPGQTGTLTLQINTLSAPPGVQGWRVRLHMQDGGQTEF